MDVLQQSSEPLPQSSSFSSGSESPENGGNKRKDKSKEPPAKKFCAATTSSEERSEKAALEIRLGGILCCAVCLDLPRSSVFQCSNGHLMCASCFNHILADARIKDDTPTCPNCRVELSRSLCTRNLAVEKAVSELPVDCIFCSQSYPRNLIENHQSRLCQDRPSVCQYSVIGCKWQGPFKAVDEHEADCQQPKLTGSQILPFMNRESETLDQEKEKLKNFMKLLSMEKLAFNDVQMRPYHTEDFINRLHYETTRFSAFGCHFSINMRLNDDKRDSHLTNDRYLSYQLVLKSKAPCPRFIIHYTIVQGSIGNMKVRPHIAQQEFTETVTESSWTLLPLQDSAECNRLLANRNIDLRIMMGQQPVSSL